MAIRLGSGLINEVRLGSTEIREAYLGATLIHDTTGGGGGGGGHTPLLVDNQGTANFTRSGSMASDSPYLWMSAVVNFASDSGTTQIFDIPGRTEFNRVNDSLSFEVKSTGNAVLFDGTLSGVSAGTLQHVYFYFDGVAGEAKAYIDGVEQAFDDPPVVAATTGTVDHSRASATLLGSVDVTQIGDLLLGTTAPPAVSSLYSGGYVDVSGVTADFSFIGNATFYNNNPETWTTNNTFVDNP